MSHRILGALLLALTAFGFAPSGPASLAVEKDAHIVLIGNNLCSRMMSFGHFETELQIRYPDRRLFIRNMCDGGNTPGFRPHSGRVSPWAFPGAETFQTELAHHTGSEGHFETPDQWLTRLEADVVIAFFGYSESFQGEEGLDSYKEELEAFVRHTASQRYNGEAPPELALVSPIAFQDLSDRFDLPDGKKENVNLALYTRAMEEVAARTNVLFVDAFTPSRQWFGEGEALTIDGFQLTDAGYARLTTLLADGVFGEARVGAENHRAAVHDAVMEKNWFWHNDFKIPNGVHVFGRRYEPFGPDNYPAELVKIREMTALRDEAIWLALQGEEMDLEKADQKTTPLPPVETNYAPKGASAPPPVSLRPGGAGPARGRPGLRDRALRFGTRVRGPGESCSAVLRQPGPPLGGDHAHLPPLPTRRRQARRQAPHPRGPGRGRQGGHADDLREGPAPPSRVRARAGGRLPLPGHQSRSPHRHRR